MTWHGYFAIEDSGLNPTQRQLLINVLRTIGPVSTDQPAHLNHWRVALDGSKAIFEAAFDENMLTIEAFKNRLGAIFGVDPATIDYILTSITFAARPTPVVVFSRTGTDYLRMALFGGPGATWADSHTEVLAYLAANRAEWEG